MENTNEAQKVADLLEAAKEAKIDLMYSLMTVTSEEQKLKVNYDRERVFLKLKAAIEAMEKK